MKSTFIKRWVGYNTLSIVISFITLIYVPITATIFVVIAQSLLLKKIVGLRAFIWLLNPILFGFSCTAYQVGIPFGVLANAIALEVVFLASTGKFSYFAWSGIVAIPVGLFILISKFAFLTSENWIAIGILFLLCSTLLWWFEAKYLNYIFSKERINNIMIQKL